MDTTDWEVLSYDGLSDFDDYDLCTSPKFMKASEASRNFHPRVPKQILHIPIQLEPRIGKAPDEGSMEENTKDHHRVEVPLVPSSPTTIENIKGGILEADYDTVAHLFSKIKEIESPKSIDRGLLFPDIGALKFEDKGGDQAQEIIMASPRMKIEKEIDTIMDCGKEVEDSSGGFNFWKWSLNGVGAICSFGFAAATICVLILGSQQRNNKIQQDQKIWFQIYTDDKRIKQVVHATKLNEAMAAVSGVPLSRARITCGGYYDGL
ncbi:hypothetical protein GLYMA_16G040300v4 [Glycine max]|uniref:DUF6821 domain-containing protein n=1 Tax=Glycine max TaxID=3847 RepID=I1ML13_SOYBN|nr:uncharacterized protein LOC100787137 [Glycine max]KRH06695.1 hypothetical protein GLYMA_16G040300v4 [Glycine max]|eukprot:XP_003548735.1 uncharacterized protein LOC100787137 [Glycine max]